LKYIKKIFKIIIWAFYIIPYNFISKIDNLNNKQKKQLGDETLRILHIFILILALVMFFVLLKYLNILYSKNEESFFSEHGSLVSGFFILMSSILASLTVMRSIKSTERREEKNLIRKYQSLQMYYIHVLDKVIQWDNSTSDFTKFNNKELIKNAEILQSLLNALSEKDIFIFIKKADYACYEELTYAMSENIKLMRLQNIQSNFNILKMKAVNIKSILQRDNNT